MSNIKKVLLAAIFLLIVVGLGMISAKVSAASIAIAPLRQELTIAPGQAYSSLLVVQNPSNKIVTVSLSAEAFGIINEDYDYSFSKLEGVSQWLSFGKTQLSLKPNESKSTSYTLSVPNNAEPGEKYIAVFASVKNETNNTTTIDRVGLLLYTTIAGNVTRKGEILTSKIPGFSFDRQVSWDLRVHSTGSAHFRSKVVATVNDIFGQTISTSTSEHLILPNTVRRLESNIGLGGLPGIYKVKLLVGLGDDPAYRKTIWVVYLPLWSIALLIAVVGFVILRVRRKSKSEKPKAVPTEEPTNAKPAVKKTTKTKAKSPIKKPTKSKINNKS